MKSGCLESTRRSFTASGWLDGVPLGAELRKVLDELADRLGIQRLQ